MCFVRHNSKDSSNEKHTRDPLLPVSAGSGRGFLPALRENPRVAARPLALRIFPILERLGGTRTSSSSEEDTEDTESISVRGSSLDSPSPTSVGDIWRRLLLLADRRDLLTPREGAGSLDKSSYASRSESSPRTLSSSAESSILE